MGQKPIEGSNPSLSASFPDQDPHQMTTTRREFVAGSGALVVALANLAACAKREQGAKRSDVEALLADIAEEILSDYPENATAFGVDVGARAALKSRLSDRSPAGQRAIAERVAKRLERLNAIDPASVPEQLRVDLDVVRTAHETAAEGFKYTYGDVALLNSNWSYRNAPYVVAQNTGAFLEIPGLL